jgi:hypothetical protein
MRAHPPVAVAIEDGDVYLAEADYEFDHVGPKSARDPSREASASAATDPTQFCRIAVYSRS